MFCHPHNNNLRISALKKQHIFEDEVSTHMIQEKKSQGHKQHKKIERNFFSF